MSLIIKGMNIDFLPKGALCANIVTNDGNPHVLVKVPDENGYAINKYFPLVEIPTPHGRLIDADRLMEVIEKNSYLLKGYYNSLENGMFLTGIRQAIDEAPTIIDVEVSE